MGRQKGFTLIELVIVIAILAILAAIAVPAYTEQVRKGRRAEAHGTLGQLQLALERWRADRPRYDNPDGLAGYPTVPTSDYYTYTIPTADATQFTVRAVPKGAQANDACGTLELQYSGGNVTKVPVTAGCW